MELDDRLTLYIYHLALGHVVAEPLRGVAPGVRRPQVVVHVDLAGSVAVCDRIPPGAAVPTRELRRDFTAVLEGLLERDPEFAVEVSVDERV